MKILKLLFSNKSKDEKNSIIASIFSISLFEISVILEIIKSKKLIVSYILLSITILLFPIIFFVLTEIYEFVVLKNTEFILYSIRKGDSLKLISKKFFPECNYEKVCKIIISKNKLSKPPTTGDLILIPVKKERKIIKIPFLHQHNF